MQQTCACADKPRFTRLTGCIDPDQAPLLMGIADASLPYALYRRAKMDPDGAFMTKIQPTSLCGF